MHKNRNPCNSFLMVKMASGMDHGCVRPTTTTNDVAQHGGHPANTKSCSLAHGHSGHGHAPDEWNNLSSAPFLIFERAAAGF